MRQIASIVPLFVALALTPALVRAQQVTAPTARQTGAGAPVAFAEARPLAADIAAMASAEGVRISPDGSTIVYALNSRTLDPDAKPSDKDPDGGWKTDRQLFIVAADGEGEPTQLTFGPEKAGAAAWSPDSSLLAFVRKHDGKQKIHVLALAGGEARPIDAGDLDPGAISWSPDGDSIAFLATPPLSQEAKDEKWRSGGARAVGEEWRSAQLYVVSVAADGEPRRVTQGPEHVTDYAWSPDSRRFLITTSDTADPYEATSLVTPRMISAKDGALLRALETDPRGIGHIEWSPDGRLVAYETGENTLSLLNVLRVREADGDGAWNAAAKLDPTLTGFVWSADSKSIISHVYEKTVSKLYKLPVDGSSATDLKFTGRVVTGAISADRDAKRLVCITSTTCDPMDPTIVDLSSGKSRVVAKLNPQAESWALGKGEVVRWMSPEGMEIEGVLYVTPHARAGRAPALMVLPHGGPDSVTTERWSAWAAYFGARGFSVFMPNYRGGTAYGHAFYAANRGRLGEIEWMDIESGVDSLIKAGKADPDRMVFGGWSWGGYLTTWAIGQTDRYKAAVVGAGVADTISMYALSDINHGVAAEWEYKGDPWRQYENFDRANPIRSIANAVTPTLIIHGEADDRVPFTSAIILHRALLDVSCETKVLAYPREPHGFREPAHTAHMLHAWAAWYDQHLTQ